MMAGAMDGKAVMPRRLTYEGPFGVGYGICTFRVTGDDDGRSFLETYESCRKEACKNGGWKRMLMCLLPAGRWSIMCAREE